MVFAGVKRKINVKYFMVAYLGLLFVFSSWYARSLKYFLAGAAVIVLYSSFDLLWTRLRDRVWYLPVSSWISGLVLSVVALTEPSVLQVIVLPLLAVTSKQLLHFGKTRHIFNPAAFGMTGLNLFLPAISWWAVSWGLIPTVAVSVGGLFILWRLERWHVVISFFGALVPLLFLTSWLRGMSLAAALGAIPPFVLSGPVIFFATVMLVEPITSSFSSRKKRLVYGFLAGIFAAGFSADSRFVPAVKLDPLVAGLLLADLSAGLLFLPPRPARLTPNVPSPPS